MYILQYYNDSFTYPSLCIIGTVHILCKLNRNPKAFDFYPKHTSLISSLQLLIQAQKVAGLLLVNSQMKTAALLFTSYLFPSILWNNQAW